MLTTLAPNPALSDFTASPHTAWADLDTSARIVIVDDEPINVKATQRFLALSGYENCESTTDPRQAMDLIRRVRPALLLLDLHMPGCSGLELLAEFRETPEMRDLLVIVLTAAAEQEAKAGAFGLGAFDFISKPVDWADLALRVRNALLVYQQREALKDRARHLEREVRARTVELEASRLEVLHCLARAAEFRDNDTGRHVLRVGRYAATLAQKMGLDAETVHLIALAAPMHDLGKIGVPDDVLLKPGRLDPDEFRMIQEHCIYGVQIVECMSNEEWHFMQRHSDIGCQILESVHSPILRMAGRIALWHHEKWDGTGYPHGLCGEQIPIEARTTAVADVFDALSTRRPYKPAFPWEKCLAILEEGRGKQFDPRVLDAFMESGEEIQAIQRELADVGA